jgi:dihydroorotase
VPGLVDLHTHCWWGGNLLSLDADSLLPQLGTTTWIDAGTAGASAFAGFRRYVIEPSRTRIRAFINVSLPGLITAAGPCHDRANDLDIDRLCETIEEHREVILGIKVLASRPKVGALGLMPVRMAVEAAEAAGLPLMCHIGSAPPGLEAVLELLRAGDTVTHCYKGNRACLLALGDRVRESARVARERGVYFDVGHGVGSFSWATARAALEQGFPPDAISTDLHNESLSGPARSMCWVMSKFLHLGMELAEIVRLATQSPARIIGAEDEIGSLRPGSCADVTVLRMEEGSFPAMDCVGVEQTMSRKLSVVATVRAGRLVSAEA